MLNSKKYEKKSFVYNTGSTEDLVPVENVELTFDLFFWTGH